MLKKVYKLFTIAQNGSRANVCEPAKEYPLQEHRRKGHLQGVGHIHIKWVVIRYSPNAPDFATHSARVSVEGLWIALVRPDIEHKPSEWGRVVVVRPFATNRGRLLAVAKLDGVCDYPNCRSRVRRCALTIPSGGLVHLCSRLVPLYRGLSPSDTNSIPYLAPNVNRFWAEILHKV